MGVKTGIFLLSLIAGCFAIPAPESSQNVDSDFFIHANAPARIVGGAEAAVGSARHMVGLSNGLLIRSFVCGGCLIAGRTVLTAAHCIDAVFAFGSLSSTLRGTVGTNRWNSGGQSYAFARNVTHPNYVSATIKNDIGMLITSVSVMYTTLVAPLPMNFEYIPAGFLARANGWGRIRQGGPLSPTLLELAVLTIDEERCVREVPLFAAALNMIAPPVEPHLEICAFHGPGHGMCNGDSGSALMEPIRNQLIGLVSWGIPCAVGAPDMFVRLSAYQSWVLLNFVN